MPTPPLPAKALSFPSSHHVTPDLLFHPVFDEAEACARSAVVLLASAYAARSVSILQTWTNKPQKRQDVSAFALTYILRLRSCKLLDAFVISSLPSLIVGDITNSRAPLLRGRYPASSLLRTHPPPSRLRSTSRFRRLYDLPCSGDFAPGRGGLLQLLSMSLSPCCRFHPAEVEQPRRSDFGCPCCLRPTVAGSALGATHFRGHIRVHCRYGPVTRDLPKGDLVDRLQSLRFPSTLLSKLRGA